MTHPIQPFMLFNAFRDRRASEPKNQDKIREDMLKRMIVIEPHRVPEPNRGTYAQMATAAKSRNAVRDQVWALRDAGICMDGILATARISRTKYYRIIREGREPVAIPEAPQMAQEAVGGAVEARNGVVGYRASENFPTGTQRPAQGLRAKGRTMTDSGETNFWAMRMGKTPAHAREAAE